MLVWNNIISCSICIYLEELYKITNWTHFFLILLDSNAYEIIEVIGKEDTKIGMKYMTPNFFLSDFVFQFNQVFKLQVLIV